MTPGRAPPRCACPGRRHGLDRRDRPLPISARSHSHRSEASSALPDRPASPAAPDRASLQGFRSVGAAGRHALELHELDDQVSSRGQIVRLQQRLLGADVERGDLGDAVDQHLVVQPTYRLPVDDITQSVGIAFRFAFQLRPLDAGQRIGLDVIRESAEIGIDLAIGRLDLGFPRDAEAADAFEDDVEAAILQLLGADDPAEAADFEQARRHTSELQSLMRTSYAVFCLKNKIYTTHNDMPKYRTTTTQRY